jgi:DNA-binding transcriptional ArsR family regulator
MNEPGEILSFVKAMASADRLRIVGLLSQGSKRAGEIADVLGMHPSDVMRHLEQLTGSGAVSEADGVYDLNEKAIESLARGQFEGKRSVYVAEEDQEEDVRKVLKAYLNADGTIRQLPQEGKKMLIILHFILDAFSFDANYTEKEVNTILRRFHTDTATLRRNLIDYGFMARESDGTRYWRIK